MHPSILGSFWCCLRSGYVGDPLKLCVELVASGQVSADLGSVHAHRALSTHGQEAVQLAGDCGSFVSKSALAFGRSVPPAHCGWCCPASTG